MDVHCLCPSPRSVLLGEDHCSVMRLSPRHSASGMVGAETMRLKMSPLGRWLVSVH